MAHKHMVEQLEHGTGKEGLEARALTWIEDRRALGKIGEKTAVGYAEKLRSWARLIGPKPMKRITAADIDRAFATLATGEGTPTGRKPSARTLHHYRTVLATFFNAMEKKTEVMRSPVRGVEGVGGLDTRTRRAPTADELRRILTAAADSRAVYGQLPTILRFASHLGLRRGEICGLRWTDINFDTMTVTIARAATQPAGKVYFKTPKSAAGVRTLAMLEPTAALLREQRKRVAAWRLAAGPGWADNDLVFPDPTGEPLNIEQLSRDAGIVRDRAGVSRAVLPLHGQRHFALTEMHRNKVDSLTIQRRAGHSDLRSTQGYITIDLDQDRAAAEATAGSLL
jgi:integrase